MLIAVMSDSHNNINHFIKAINLSNQRGCEYLIHCGDYCRSFMLKEFEKFQGKAYGVLGNIDENRFTMENEADMVSNFILMGTKGKLEINGKLIGFSHYPEDARNIVSSGNYTVVFYGHTHRFDISKMGATWLINPGEILGRMGTSSLAIFNLSTEECERIDII